MYAVITLMTGNGHVYTQECAQKALHPESNPPWKYSNRPGSLEAVGCWSLVSDLNPYTRQADSASAPDPLIYTCISCRRWNAHYNEGKVCRYCQFH